jgi:hypothetical protein
VTGNGVTKIEALDCIGEIAHEVAAPELAVGKDIQAQLLLLLEDVQDVAVFECMKFICGNIGLPCLKQLWRAQQAAHMISSES